MSGGDWKAMFKGIQDNDVELVKYYLKIGVDPNYQHPEYLALPLSEAIRYNQSEIIKLLLSFGANPTIVEIESKMTSLELAKKMKNQLIINLIKEHVSE